MTNSLRSALADIATAIGRLDEDDMQTLKRLLANASRWRNYSDRDFIVDGIVRYLAAPVGEPLRETET